MADSQTLLERLKQESRVIKDLGSASTIEELATRPRYALYRAVSGDKSQSNIIVYGRDGEQDTDVRALLTRLAVASTLYTQLVPGFCPQVIEQSSSAPLVVLEDLPLHRDNLGSRVYGEGQVDHNITCNLARHLAGLHQAAQGEQLAELSQRLGPQVPNNHNVDQVFRTPYTSHPLSECDESLAGAIQKVRMNQDLRTSVEQIRENFQMSNECLLHGAVTTDIVWVNAEDGSVKMTDVGSAGVGPRAFDVGSLVADYICGYYYHMLTKEDNDRHRRVSYSLQEAITKTVDTYLEALTLAPAEKKEFLKQLAGFTGVHLIKRAVCPDSSVRLPDYIRQEILGSGSRLVSKRSNIDLVGRLLLIALQLC